MCRGVFEKAWTDEEALAEMATVFPVETAAREPFAIVCDACYQRIAPPQKES
jgi:hypothetical protein